MASCASWLSLFFFFKQKTAYEMRISDWSSDVCSSDLTGKTAGPAGGGGKQGRRRRVHRHADRGARPARRLYAAAGHRGGPYRHAADAAHAVRRGDRKSVV